MLFEVQDILAKDNWNVSYSSMRYFSSRQFHKKNTLFCIHLYVQTSKLCMFSWSNNKIKFIYSIITISSDPFQEGETTKEREEMVITLKHWFCYWGSIVLACWNPCLTRYRILHSYALVIMSWILISTNFS